MYYLREITVDVFLKMFTEILERQVKFFYNITLCLLWDEYFASIKEIITPKVVVRFSSPVPCIGPSNSVFVIPFKPDIKNLSKSLMHAISIQVN